MFWLSALVAVLGAFLLTNSDSLVVLTGSFDYIKRLTIFIFHENWLIYTLPLLAIAQFFQVFGAIDLRVVFTILAGSLYFLIQVLDIHRLVITKRIQRG